jgi:Uncharacterized protein with SCP/PR1 domains
MQFKFIVHAVTAAAILSSAAIVFAQSDGQSRPKPEVEANSDSPVAEQPAVGKLILARSNALRAGEKLAELRGSDELMKAAQEFAAFMARTGKYGHTADDRQPRERAAAQGYEACIVAENIGQQFSTRPLSSEQLAREFVEGWANSKEHRANLLDPDVSEIGTAVSKSEKTGHFYAVQLFGRPKSESIRIEIENGTSAAVKYELGNESYDLEGRFARIHELCRPTEITFLLPKADGTERSVVQPVKAKSRLVIKRDESQELVVVRRADR